jgi:hypothetical protein
VIGWVLQLLGLLGALVKKDLVDDLLDPGRSGFRKTGTEILSIIADLFSIVRIFKNLLPGANPATFGFTATTPALYYVEQSVFTSEKNNGFS